MQGVAPAQVVTTQNPSAVRVQRLDGSRFVVDSPRISGDSLLGAMAGKPTSIPLADIHRCAVKHGSAGKTVGLVLAVTVGVIVLAGVMCEASDCTGGWQ